MATMWRKAMLYLGLEPDEEYDDYDVGYDDPAPDPRPARPPVMAGPPPEESSAIGAVRPMTPNRRPDENGPGLGGAGGGGIASRPRPKVVRPLPVATTARPRLVVPSSFNQAQELADTFKGDQPVVVNLRHAERELSRRLIDFASGLCYGLGGQMEKLDSQVYLLTPANVEVSVDERRRLAERGYED